MKTNAKISKVFFKAKTLLIITILALCFIPTEQKAQTFTTGITAGVSTSSVNISNIDNSFTNNIKGKGIMGFEGGLFERLNLGAFFIKPMVLVAYQGGTATYYNSDGSFNSAKFDYGNIEVPLLFGLKILGPLRVEAGPVYNWIYSTQYSDGENNSITTNPSGLGYRIGANVELGMLNLGLAYQGITYKPDNSTTTTFSSPNELIFSLALCFGD